jgi:hypothetical protein
MGSQKRMKRWNFLVDDYMVPPHRSSEVYNSQRVPSPREIINGANYLHKIYEVHLSEERMEAEEKIFSKELDYLTINGTLSVRRIF